jgi:hypothetical protein
VLYKTIVLEMLQNRPELYNRLRNKRTLRQAMESYATELSQLHTAWEEAIGTTPLAGSQRQIASAALELAIEDLAKLLSAETATPEELSLDDAMAYIRRHTPPA